MSPVRHPTEGRERFVPCLVWCSLLPGEYAQRTNPELLLRSAQQMTVQHFRTSLYCRFTKSKNKET